MITSCGHLGQNTNLFRYLSTRIILVEIGIMD